MEHKLILGGEQYLPFARSRLKALRAATGLFAARQQFVTGDGVDITVRYVGDQEYITIEGGQLSIAMDAGLIDLKSIAPASPLRYASGTRQETTSTQAYNAPFTLGATAGKWSAWRTNPNPVPFHQIAGTLSAPPFTGYLRNGDQAPSFRAKRKAVTPATVPPTWQDDPEDTALLAKKTMALKCPASVFTGRTRLYVQALYGRPLHVYGSEISVTAAVPVQLLPSLASESPPSLRLPAHTRPDDEVTYPALTIDTNTGVHFDPATGKHWLLQITPGHVNVYPLLSSAAGESMRKYLAGAKVNKTDALGDDDKERLEAFILAYCLPDVKNVIAIECTGASGAYSMGYGWHWNWSGTAADAVTSTTFDQGIISGIACTAMESTHRRVTVALVIAPPTEENPKGVETWTAAHAVVEGPKRWAVSRVFWCIAEPEWGSMQTLKSTPRNSSLFNCNAPFYVYYKRDELQLCRISVTTVPATTNQRTFSVGFAVPTYGDPVAMFTCGPLNGFCEDAAATTAHSKASITCGEVTATDLVIGKSTSYAFWGVSNKFMPAVPSRIFANDAFDSSTTPAVRLSGFVGVNAVFGPTISTVITGPGTGSVSSVPVYQFTRTTNDGVRTESSTITAIVPFYDAEAIFLDTAAFSDDARTNQQVSVRESGAFASGWFWIPYPTGTTLLFLTFEVGGTAGTILSSSTPADTVVSTVIHDQKLVCRAGPIDATLGELGSFHNAEDYAQVSYSVLSGTAAVLPVVISPGNAVPPVGIVGDVPQFPALVGRV